MHLFLFSRKLRSSTLNEAKFVKLHREQEFSKEKDKLKKNWKIENSIWPKNDT